MTPRRFAPRWVPRWLPAVLVLAFVVLTPAAALAVGVRVCVSALNRPEQLWDYSPTHDGRELHDDFGRLDVPGSLVVPHMLTSVVLKVDGDPRIWGWAPLDEQGCTTQFDAPAGAPLEIETYYWSYDASTDVSVVSLNCTGAIDCRSDPSLTTIPVPQFGGTISISLPFARHAYVHFAAATAESRLPTSRNTTYYTRTGISLQTISNRIAGGWPTASFGGETFRRKYTVTHEYGHLKTLIAWLPTLSQDDVDYCYQDQNGCTLSWTADSPEYQSAAAIEGFAEFFSMLVWNDVEGQLRDGVLAKARDETEWRCRFRPDPAQPDMSALPDACNPLNTTTTIADSWHHQVNCDPMDCPSGVATAWDWAFALWDMHVMTSAPPQQLLGLLQLTYPWPVNGEDSDYWDEFVSEIAGPGLAGDDLIAWLEFAHIRGIDR